MIDLFHFHVHVVFRLSIGFLRFLFFLFSNLSERHSAGRSMETSPGVAHCNESFAAWQRNSHQSTNLTFDSLLHHVFQSQEKTRWKQMKKVFVRVFFLTFLFSVQVGLEFKACGYRCASWGKSEPMRLLSMHPSVRVTGSDVAFVPWL